MIRLESSARGVYIIAVTPFHDDGRLHLADIGRLTDVYLERGVSGLTVIGVMGEAHAQILTAANENRPALLARPGDRDWIYAADAGDAILAAATAPGHYRGNVYNVTSGLRTSALDFRRALIRWRPGLIRRLAEAGETATINLHAGSGRPSLASGRMTAEFGWCSRRGLEESVADLVRWRDRHGDRPAS